MNKLLAYSLIVGASVFAAGKAAAQDKKAGNKSVQYGTFSAEALYDKVQAERFFEKVPTHPKHEFFTVFKDPKGACQVATYFTSDKKAVGFLHDDKVLTGVVGTIVKKFDKNNASRLMHVPDKETAGTVVKEYMAKLPQCKP